eukprot:COSAG05_NODE_3836_length_1812_cov_2.752481_1_plen_266_part_00
MFDAYVSGRNLGAAAALAYAALQQQQHHGATGEPPSAAPQPLHKRLLLWGCFLRCLALVYAISFWSLGRQLQALCGSRGISPVAPQLAAIRRDFGAARGFGFFPTLLWFFSSDTALSRLPLIGQACACGAAACGGTTGWLCLLAAHVLLLSIDWATDLQYPWDCLLFESGFLALFLPALSPIYAGLEISELPHPFVAWGFRWLLFRLILGFGKLKFYRKRKEDASYIRAHHHYPFRYSVSLCPHCLVAGHICIFNRPHPSQILHG